MREFDELTKGAFDYLVSRLGYRYKSAMRFRRCWREIKQIMISSGIKTLSKVIEKEIHNCKFNGRSPIDLTKYDKHFLRSLDALFEFQETGKIGVIRRSVRRNFVFDGPIGKAISSYLEYKRHVEGCSDITISSCQYTLSHFLRYCNSKGLKSTDEINLALIHGFVSETTTYKRDCIPRLRGFLKYLFEENILTSDFSLKLPKVKSVVQPKLPAAYSADTIEKLLLSIDRASLLGKRDYAIILIGARLGFRGADIAQLKFDNLDWDNDQIRLTHSKTKEAGVYPLLPDIGNAIIDYIQNARPQSEEPFVFLKAKPSQGALNGHCVSGLVRRAFLDAGVNTGGHRFGSHSLRHSVSTQMLANGVRLEVISAVLSHASQESTRNYLRIDLKSMRQCILEVPAIPITFYQQKGGHFYE